MLFLILSHSHLADDVPEKNSSNEEKISSDEQETKDFINLQREDQENVVFFSSSKFATIIGQRFYKSVAYEFTIVC